MLWNRFASWLYEMKQRKSAVPRWLSYGVVHIEDTTMVDFYSAAARSFQQNLDRIETGGGKDSPDWWLVRGLLQLTQGLQEAREEEEDIRKCFARPSSRPKVAR